MDVLTILSIIALVLTVITTVSYSYQVFYMLLPIFHRRRLPEKGPQRRYAIVIAARNEEAVLPHLLDSINALDYPKELVTTFVVADNCTDATADVARDRGAVVYTRTNHTEIGKGYALEYLLENIRRDFGWSNYDAFLVFDADNLLRQDYLTQMDRLTDCDVLTSFRNTKNFSDSWISATSGVWYLHESTHMNMSRDTLGCNCVVSGTGFGFTSRVLEQLGGWPFHLLTEDLEFNNWCATNNIKSGYCHDAIFYDEQPITLRQSWKQRIRWVQGGLQVSLRYGRSLAKGVIQGPKRYSCFELLTLSLWGVAVSSLSGLFGSLVSFLGGGLIIGLISIGLALVGAYFSLLAMAVLTMVLIWKRVPATRWQLAKSCLLFPVFIATYLPVAATALFKKFEWAPIPHTAAVSADDLK